MKSNIDVQVIKKKAEEYYRCGEFYCSEAIVKTIKDEFELELPDQVIAMASGFPVTITRRIGCFSSIFLPLSPYHLHYNFLHFGLPIHDNNL